MKRRAGDTPVPEPPAIGADTTETLQEFEELVARLSRPMYLFRLYVAGNTRRSGQAITNIRAICDRYLPSQYELEVIDVYQQPEATRTADLIALPTLIKELPAPAKRFVGNMSDTERIVIALKLGNQI